jgi:hypothetical protein
MTCLAVPPAPPKPPGTNTGVAALLGLAAALALSLAAAPPLSAQLDPSIFAGQPPITLRDVPAALDAMREINKVKPDMSKMAQIARNHGTTTERLNFLVVKFIAGGALLKPDGLSAAELEKEAGTPLVIPNPDELEVIRSAMSATGWQLR